MTLCKRVFLNRSIPKKEVTPFRFDVLKLNLHSNFICSLIGWKREATIRERSIRSECNNRQKKTTESHVDEDNEIVRF